MPNYVKCENVDGSSIQGSCKVRFAVKHGQSTARNGWEEPEKQLKGEHLSVLISKV